MSNDEWQMPARCPERDIVGAQCSLVANHPPEVQHEARNEEGEWMVRWNNQASPDALPDVES